MSLLFFTCAAINAFFLNFCDSAMHLFAMLAFALLVYDVFIQCLCVYVVLLHCCNVKRKNTKNKPVVVTVKREKREQKQKKT